MTPLIAEDLLLLLLDDETGRLKQATYLDPGIGGALLVELAMGGHVEVRRSSGLWARSLVHPVPEAAPPEHPVLQEALATITEKQRSAQDLVNRLGKKRRRPLLDGLVARGVLGRTEDRVLGVFPRTRWPEVDDTREARVRRALGAALVGGSLPDERTAALIGLLSALDLAHKVVAHDGLPRREVRKRAKVIADGDWAAKAVKDAVAAAQAAVTAAVLASTTTAAASG